MLNRISHNSEELCIVVDQLNVKFGRPHLLHILNVADVLLARKGKKTLAAEWR